MRLIFSLMRRFTIRFRMLSAIAVVLGLLGLLGGAGMFGMFRIHGMGDRLVNQSMAGVDRLDKLRFAISQVRRLEKDMII